VVVHLPGQTVYISGDRIQQQADVPPTNYTLRSAAGSETDSHSGLSIRKLIALAGGNPDQLGFLRIQRPDGSFAFLTHADLADPPDFQEGPALVFMDGDTAHFFRPVRSDTDVNAADNVATVAGKPLVMSAHTGDLIAVKAKADPKTTKATQDVSFSATVSGPHRNDQLQYSWHFDDGTVGHGPNPTHAFAQEGGYNVFVTVAGDADSGGASDTIHVTVGKPPSGSGDQSGGGSTDENAPGGGPVSGGGGGNSGSGGGGGGGSSIPPSTTPSTNTPPPILNSTPQTPPQPLTSIPKVEPGTKTISGILLASSNPVPIGSLLASPGSPAAARAGSTPHRELPIMGAAVVLLLGLGAFREGARGRIRIPKLWPR
jgi:PKD domain